MNVIFDVAVDLHDSLFLNGTSTVFFNSNITVRLTACSPLDRSPSIPSALSLHFKIGDSAHIEFDAEKPIEVKGCLTLGGSLTVPYASLLASSPNTSSPSTSFTRIDADSYGVHVANMDCAKGTLTPSSSTSPISLPPHRSCLQATSPPCH